VKLEHLRAFISLRWKLKLRQFRRGGVVNAIALGFVVFLVSGVAALAAVGMFFVGYLALAKESPAVIMYVWDGVVVGFLFFWAVGLLAELQRSESLSLAKFLHLPVSPAGICLINYVSSLFSLGIAVFAPAMLALAIGLCVGRGPALIWLLPLVVAFLFMISALTYQFQGWLAALMINPRRRRTVIVLVTVAFIVLVQGPNMAQMYWRFDHQDRRQPRQVTGAMEAGRIGIEEYERRQKEYKRQQAEADEQAGRERQEVENTAYRYATVLNLVLPPGWLALGALYTAEGSSLPALAAIGGMSLVGLISLWRSYRTTVKIFTGAFTGRKSSTKALVAVAVQAADKVDQPLIVERNLPWIGERATAIALAGFRGLARAPEAKLMLLGPVILVFVFGSMFFTGRIKLPTTLSPLMAAGAMTMVLFTMMQILGNQFGFDRGGFRVFVLSPARRRDILLGKNLSMAPWVFALAAVVVAALQLAFPMRLDELVACVPLFAAMYMVFSLWANLLSILAPMAIPAGTLRPSNPKFWVILLHMVFMFMTPVIMSPLLLPWGITAALRQYGFNLPICTLLTVVMTAVVGVIYWLILDLEGDLLARREQKILETVVSKVE
jgi:hypothetical protein